MRKKINKKDDVNIEDLKGKEYYDHCWRAKDERWAEKADLLITSGKTLTDKEIKYVWNYFDGANVLWEIFEEKYKSKFPCEKKRRSIIDM